MEMVVAMVMIATLMVLFNQWGMAQRMTPVLTWYGGVYTSDSWNQPVTYNHIQFPTKIANVRRALFLCDQPDTFHIILITMGGIKSV